MKNILTDLAMLVLLTAIVYVSCPARPLCPTHHVEMDQISSNCDDSGKCTVVYRCPAGGEDYTVHCRGGE
jgi:hypothetical protein